MCEALNYSFWLAVAINVVLIVMNWRQLYRLDKMDAEHATQNAILRDRWLARLSEADAFRMESRKLRDEWKAAKMQLPTSLTNFLKGHE